MEPRSCELRVYASLHDFRPRGARPRVVDRPVGPAQTVKDVIEAAGIPHTEVGLIVVDGEAVGFEHRLGGGERVAVYPRFEALPLPENVNLAPADRPDERFVADVHLGRLVRWLRLLGVDTWYRVDADDEELAGISVGDDRTLLTRDVGLLKRGPVRRGYWVRATRPRAQVVEVLRRFPLGPAAVPFSRCLVCNGVLQPVAKEAVAGQVPPRSYAAFDEYRRCPDCARVYWSGTHHERLVELVRELLDAVAGGRDVAAEDPP